MSLVKYKTSENDFLKFLNSRLDDLFTEDSTSQQFDDTDFADFSDKVISNSNIIVRNEALLNSTNEFYSHMQKLYKKFLDI